ncbi:hypothetical protein [Rothia terrae]|uniref:Uncharacterized protein n=1 Tax=Rothia terrae TaxID=396015 RepID=A0A7H2BB73_9MICC|nr:hypothetical protein [Rothia terrae]QNV36919.1 hypothetical protein IDM49_06485 [Rothia terrae]
MAEFALGDRGSVTIITNDFYDAEILQVFEELQIDRERIWNGPARLVPEPDNAYAPNTIAVYIDDLKVGRLSAEHSAQYWKPITRVVSSGYDAMAHLQLSAVLRKLQGEHTIESTGILSLSAPGSLFPLNQAPVHATLLPQGASMKVLDENDHSAYLHTILPPSGEGRVILTLEANQIKLADGSVVDSIDVLHDRKVVGRLSTQISEQLAPVIKYAFEHEKLTSAWGTIRGNAFEVSLTVQAARPSELSDEWYRTLPNNVPELIEEADSYVVPDAYVPTEGESQQNASTKSRRRGFGATVAPVAAVASVPSRSKKQSEKAPQEGTGSSSKLAALLGVLGGLILTFGIVLVFVKPPLLGILAIVLGASLAFMGLYFGRYNEEPEYDIVDS